MHTTRKSLMQGKVKKTWKLLAKSLILHMALLVAVIICHIVIGKAILAFNPGIVTGSFGWLFITLFSILFVALVSGVMLSAIEKIDWYMTSLFNYIGLGVDVELELRCIDEAFSKYGYATFSNKGDTMLRGEKIGHEESLDEILSHIPRID